MQNSESKFRKNLAGLALGLFVSLFLAFVGLYPEICLRQQRGADFRGIYAYNDLDETAYSAYLQALIDGRPRRSNPFTGVDDSSVESLFSIQFLAPSVVAFPARIFGADASTALAWLSGLAAFAAAALMFWLALRLTESPFAAGAITLVTLCCGVLIIGEGAIIDIRYNWGAYPYFPFLRRYVPAVPFPVFWLMCGAVWGIVSHDDLRRRIFFSVLASMSFAFLIYSYFYHWTTAAAWLVCVLIVWLVFRPDNWLKDAKAFGVLFVLAGLSLIPYAILLMNRDTAMDSVQLLVKTRQPDLLRMPELWSMASLFLLLVSFLLRGVSSRNKIALFAMSLALVPFAVFNQQIITGRVLQPIHYDVFIVNYVSLFAFCVSLFVFLRGKSEKLPRMANFGLPVVILAACAWGIVEIYYTVRIVQDTNAERDAAAPVSQKLRELAKTELFDENGKRRVVLPLNLLQGDDQPTFAPQGILWARHQHVFAGESLDENRLRFYHFLFYTGYDADDLDRRIHEGDVIMIITLFGWDRLSSRLSSEARPVTEGEVRAEVARYQAFVENFNAAEAARHRLSYLTIHAETNADFTNIDRFYERDNGEQFDKYILYRLKVRQ